MRSALVLAVLACALVLPAGAQACSLRYFGPKARVGAAQLAVYGRVMSRELVDPGTGRAGGAVYRYRLDVARTYKGRPVRSLVMTGSSDGATCGVGVLTVGA